MSATTVNQQLLDAVKEARLIACSYEPHSFAIDPTVNVLSGLLYDINQVLSAAIEAAEAATKADMIPKSRPWGIEG